MADENTTETKPMTDAVAATLDTGSIMTSLPPRAQVRVTVLVASWMGIICLVALGVGTALAKQQCPEAQVAFTIASMLAGAFSSLLVNPKR